MRNTVLAIYQPSHLAKLVPQMQHFIESATPNFDTKEEEDISFTELSLKMATDVIGQAAFGVDFGLSKPKESPSHQTHHKNDEKDQAQDFIKQHMYSTAMLKMDLSGSFSIILGLLIPILQEPFRQILKRIPGTVDWKMERTNNNLSGQLDKIVEKIMKLHEEDKGDSKDFLSLILKARESTTKIKNIFTPEYISAVAYEHLLAVSTSTAFTLSSIIYLVSGHPKVEEKLLREIDAFGLHDQVPTALDLQTKFPYLDQVVKGD